VSHKIVGHYFFQHFTTFNQRPVVVPGFLGSVNAGISKNFIGNTDHVDAEVIRIASQGTTERFHGDKPRKGMRGTGHTAGVEFTTFASQFTVLNQLALAFTATIAEGAAIIGKCTIRPTKARLNRGNYTFKLILEI